MYFITYKYFAERQVSELVSLFSLYISDNIKVKNKCSKIVAHF